MPTFTSVSTYLSPITLQGLQFYISPNIFFCAQGLFLNLCSGMIPSCAQETICKAKSWIRIGCVKSKSLNICTMSLYLIVLFRYLLWIDSFSKLKINLLRKCDRKWKDKYSRENMNFTREEKAWKIFFFLSGPHSAVVREYSWLFTRNYSWQCLHFTHQNYFKSTRVHFSFIRFNHYLWFSFEGKVF